MKKIMIAAAIVCAAVASQAAVTKWSVDDLLIPVATNPKMDQTGITTDWDTHTPFAAGALAVELFYNNGTEWVSLVTSPTTDAGSIAPAELWSQAKTKEILNALETKVVQFKIEASYETADGVYTYVQDPISKDLTKVYNGQSNVTVPFSTYDGSWNYKAGGSVPEPTSGLLLILGIAGLALRRRHS